MINYCMIQQEKRWLENLYGNGVIQLDYKSCEMIAEELIDTINAKYPGRYIRVSVSEDGENGCELVADYRSGIEMRRAH